MMNINYKKKKVVSKAVCLGLGTAMALGLAGCGKGNAEEASAGASVITLENQQKALEEILDGQVTASHSSTAGKEETVYVMADASGRTDHVIVSSWLKNASGDERLTDISDLTDIENVKGYETFEAGEGGALTWQAKGSDIYYQGTTDKELPVEVKLSYRLDGKEIAPEELAGKSGRVTIRMDYENRETTTISIRGSKEEIRVPFAMISGMVLPQDVFSNIEVKNARLLSEGENSVVVGVAFPGLKESIDVDGLKEKLSEEDKEELADDMEIPEYIEVTADAKNFELGMTMTIAMSDVLSDIQLTDSFDLADLNSSMDDLREAADELKDGTSDLKDGSGRLKDGTVELVKGTDELYDGAAKLKDGTQELYEKSGRLADGARQLDDGASALLDGTRTLKDGTSRLRDGSAQLQGGGQRLLDGTGALVSGAKQLDAGADSLKNGLATASEGAKKLQYSLSEMTNENGENVSVLAGSQRLVDNAALLNSLVQTYFAGTDQSLAELSESLSSQIASAQENKAAAQAGAQQAAADADSARQALDGACTTSIQSFEVVTGTDIQTVSKDVEVQVEVPATSQRTISFQAQSAGEDGEEGQGEYFEETVEEVTGTETCTVVGTAQMEVPQYYMERIEVETISSGDIQAAFAAYEEASARLSYYQSMASACDAQIQTLEAIASALSNVNSGQAAEAKEGIRQLAAGIAGGTQSLNQGLSQVSAGVNQLVGETPDQGLQALNAGALQLKEGTATAVSGAQELDSGAGELKQGIDSLNEGAGELDAGAESLRDGAASLKDGASQMQDGTGQLVEGTGTLNEGAGTLKDGVGTLKDGVLTLDDGMGELDEGALKLVDGMFQFDEEGISRMTELFGDDVQDVVDRLEAVAQAGKDYNTFAGLPQGMDGSVKFVIKTEGVK